MHATIASDKGFAKEYALYLREKFDIKAYESFEVHLTTKHENIKRLLFSILGTFYKIASDDNVSEMKPSDAHLRFVLNEVNNLLLGLRKRFDSTKKRETLMPLRMAIHLMMQMLSDEGPRVVYYELHRGASSPKPFEQFMFFLDRYENDMQLTYEMIYCIWLLSFNPKFAHLFYVENGVNDMKTFSLLHHILKNTNTEKVIRITVALFRNLVSSSSSKLLTCLVRLSVPKTLANFAHGTFQDEDIMVEVNALVEELEEYIEQISSFDEYRQEVISNRLLWTPVHKSEKFWRENIKKFGESDFLMIRMLTAILHAAAADVSIEGLPEEAEIPAAEKLDVPEITTKLDQTVICVACHDIGQFVSYHPRGKKILEEYGTKFLIYKLMEHPSDLVRREALGCTQKMLLQRQGDQFF